MHMPASAVNGAIVPPAAAAGSGNHDQLAALAWRRLAPERWPVPPDAFPPGTALVGGAVRDALLNRLTAQPDLDLVLPGDAIGLCRQLRRSHGGSAVVLDAERSIARLVIDGWSVDLARQEGGSLMADLHRRDYTINAMALPLATPDTLVDPLGGAGHLATAELVAVSEANLLDDPLRLLRGLRLAGELSFRIEPRSLAWIQRHHARLGQVAGERVLAELEKLAAAAAGEQELNAVLRYQLLQTWRAADPASAADEALLARLRGEAAAGLGLSLTETAAALPLARLAAVLDGPSLRALRSSRRLQQRVERLRHWRQRLGDSAPAKRAAALAEMERLQLQRQLESDLPALLLGWPASDSDAARDWLQRWRDKEDPLFHPRAAIDGGSLQRELQLQASPQLGALLERLMLERAFGRLHNRDDAVTLARQWLESANNDGAKAPRHD
jgi:tRNA nucleotidyltransferase (CCA-adding enzyme)